MAHGLSHPGGNRLRRAGRTDKGRHRLPDELLEGMALRRPPPHAAEVHRAAAKHELEDAVLHRRPGDHRWSGPRVAGPGAPRRVRLPGHLRAGAATRIRASERSVASKTAWTSPAPAADCPAPKRSSNYEPSTATATSQSTGATTSTKNNNESTSRATPVASSHAQHDTPSTLQQSRTHSNSANRVFPYAGVYFSLYSANRVFPYAGVYFSLYYWELIRHAR